MEEFSLEGDEQGVCKAVDSTILDTVTPLGLGEINRREILLKR